MSWEDTIRVTYLGHYDILKMLGPKDFLIQMQDIVGGEIKGGYKKGFRGRQTLDISLIHYAGYVKIRGQGKEFYVSVNGVVIGEDFDLANLVDATKAKLE